MPGRDGTGPDQEGSISRRGRGAGQAQGRGLGGGFARGPNGECRCPNCNHREPHQLGEPCYAKKCPKCGALMTRA